MMSSAARRDLDAIPGGRQEAGSLSRTGRSEGYDAAHTTASQVEFESRWRCHRTRGSPRRSRRRSPSCDWRASTGRTRCCPPISTPRSARRRTGYPIREYINRLVDGDIIWAPAIDGAFVLSTRGGDFDLQLGTDVSIGYLSHDIDTVQLYLAETPDLPELHRGGSVAPQPVAGRPTDLARAAVFVR